MVRKNKNVEFNISSSTSEYGSIDSNFYTGDKGSATIGIKVKYGKNYLDLTKTGMTPKLDLFHSDGSIWMDQDLYVPMPDVGLIQYNIPENVIKHKGSVKAKLFLVKDEKSIHVANFTFDIKDSGIEGTVGKEIQVEVLDDIVRKFMADNAMGLLDEDYKEKINKDVIDYVASNPDKYKGKDGFSDYLDISSFNIVDDGITDNRLELTKIIQKAKEENKKVFIPKVIGKGYYVSDYININGGNNIYLVSNSATILGKCFNFSNISGLDIQGFIFKGKNTDTYSDDGIRVFNSHNINIINNMFDSSFVRCRVENQEDSNENININNNIFVGNVENQKNSSNSNLIEIYGYKNVTIDNNYINAYNYHRFIKLSSIIFKGDTGLQVVRDKGIVDGVTITNNTIKGSVNNKQVIDGFSGINNLILHNNLFDVKGATTIFENKIASGSDSFKVASCKQMSIKDNVVNIYDNTMSNVFYAYSYMGTPLQETDNTHYSNVNLSGNKVNNYTDRDITLGTIAGFKNVTVNDNILNSGANNGIFYAISIHSCENITHTNNIYGNGSLYIYPTKDTSDPSVSFNMSSKNIISKGNLYNNIRSYGGEVIRNHNSIKNIIISNNNYIGNKVNNNYILSNIYIRDITSSNVVVLGNSSVFDQEQSNITKVIYSNVVNYKEYGNSWNKSETDTNWITYKLINGALSNTTYKNTGENGFDCAYRTITNGNTVMKKLRINGSNLAHGQIIAQLPTNFVKNTQSFPVQTHDITNNAYVVIKPNGEVSFYVSDSDNSWNETGYIYAELTWHD